MTIFLVIPKRLGIVGCNMKIITELDIDGAVKSLARSERGRRSMHDTLAMLDNGGITLDAVGQSAVLVLLQAAWGAYPGTARDAIRGELGL
jgi:hypothetical protein